MPPPGARLRTGAMISAQPELKVPIRPKKFLTVLYPLALLVHVCESHDPLAAVESSHDAYVIVLSPILKFICFSSRRMAATICTASGRSEPCRGRSLAITYLPLPNV